MLVFDRNRFGSKREIDDNGYLRVSACNITKTQIRPYLGKEIPNWRDFGLDAETIYNVYCPAEELKNALETFNNLPLTREHIEVDVENVPKDKIVGSLGDRAEFKSPYVKNSLIVYDKKDIDWILSGKKKELSCGYRYTPVRQSGEFEGKHYDFIMTDIVGNHVALVKEGRAGHDVMVADECPQELEPNFTENQNDNKLLNKGEEVMLAQDEFKEADHPRDKDGKFTTAGSGSSAGGSEKTDHFKSELTKHVVRKDSPNYKAELSAAKNDLKEAISAFEKNVENQQEKFKWIEQARLDIAKKDLERLEAFEKEDAGSIEHNGAKIDIKKDGKYADIKIYAPEGKKFKNGDTFYTTEAEADKAEELAKKIIDNEFGGEGSEKKEESSKVSSKIENHLKEKITGWYKNAKQDYDVDGEFLGVEEKINSSGGKDLVIKYKEDGKELKSTIGWYEEYTPEQMYDIWMEQGADDEITKDKKLSESEQEKVGVVMKEFKDGELKSSSGEKVTDPKQAKAIALSEADRMAKDADIPEKAGKPEKAGEKEALNQGENKMAEEVKKDLAEKKVEETKEEKVVEDACGKAKDAKGAKDEGVDKRKLIDEIGGILKGKLDEELWRTVIKKAEELAYNDSERSADDKKTVKDEDKKDLKGKEEKAFAEGVVFGEKKEKEEPKKLDSEHESEGMKKAEEKKDEKKAEDKCTMDAQLAMDIDAIKEQVRAEVMADFKAREDARKAVRSIVGDVNVMAFDSADGIYKFACEKAGMDLTEIVSFKDAFRGLSASKKLKLAMDASPVSGSNEECSFDNIRLA